MIWHPQGIPLAPWSFKNDRRPDWKPDGSFVLYLSENAEKFKTDAALLWGAQRPNPPFDANDKLRLDFAVRYPDYMRDFVGGLEAICDALALARIIVNDRQIRALGRECWAFDDVGDPMTWVRLEKIGKLPWQSKAKT